MIGRPVTDFYTTVHLVFEFFKGDWEKTCLWFETENPLLGGIKPWDLLLLGKSAKLLKFVQTQLEENKPE